ncbi:hypothetical protein BSU04_45645 [Caballeronia sordidicola]|uniref:Uncharacterized protein n=1 Tax=Caballeronia sordidicola TaxID=196367 RepID=A0A226WMC5_CABSO|nr:hypothetical protein BSU04_45645 [Caballeronia sordidicola]
MRSINIKPLRLSQYSMQQAASANVRAAQPSRIEWALAGWIRRVNVRATVRANDASWPASVDDLAATIRSTGLVR